MSGIQTPSPLSQELWKRLAPQERASLAAQSRWHQQARPDQLTPPGDWPIWLALAGRGWGKTRTGAEDIAAFGCNNPGSRIAIVAPTASDTVKVCVEGQSGLLAVLPKECVANWNRSHPAELRLWNGTIYQCYSASEPERLRGPQHDRAWGDEVAAWPEPETLEQLLFGLRLGDNPQAVLTTTPKPTPLIRSILKIAGAKVTRGSTFDNAANLPEKTLERFRERYEGTRLGRQELYAELLEDVQGALWTAADIDRFRCRGAPDLRRIVVAVDPSGTSGGGAGDDVGIVVAGKGFDDRYYVLEDASCNLSPNGWARKVAECYARWGADRVIAERNFGGAMVESVMRTANKDLPVRLVTASRGKIARAEPIAALYEQEKVSHVGVFDALEDQLCAMTPGGYVGEGSPDRADALVWALSELQAKGYRYSLAEAL